MNRVLGLDLGEKRIGVAVADLDAGAARPLTTIRRARTPEADAATIARLAGEQGAAEVIVGHPLEASGEVGPQAEHTEAWLAAVGAAASAAGLRFSLRDERLSSHVAEGRLGPMPRGRSGGPPTASQRQAYRATVDREAAAVILQDELDARRASAVRR